MINWYYTGFFISFLAILGILATGIRIIRPIDRGLVERLGKYNRFCNPGFNYIIPLFEQMVRVNITETMVDAEPQEIITNDNLNARVDAQVYFKVKSDEKNVTASQYNVNDYKTQIVSLSRTTLRNIIGTMKLKEANSERDRINKELMKTLIEETKSWGIEVVRTELKEIDPPKDVQETMNKVVKAENEKVAAIDFATAKETEADGLKRASIKEAEGIAMGRKIVADAQAYKVKVENEAARKYFKAEAQKLKQLEVTQEALKNNSKIILGADNKSLLKLFDIGK